MVAACDLLALTLTTPPGEWGADVAVGSSQRFGVPLFYGGPHAGFIAVRAGLERTLPGRLVGVSKDVDGTAGVPARPADPGAAHPAGEGDLQHLHRPGAAGGHRQHVRGLPRPATGCGPSPTAHARARHRAGRRPAGGRDRGRARRVLRHRARPGARAGPTPWSAAAREAGVHLRLVDADHVGIAVGEDATRGGPGRGPRARSGSPRPARRAYGDLAGSERTSRYLTHPVFNTHHSETAMLRYLRALSDRDFALDRGMIPLGSCTMKLNATTEMEPISYPGFADLHPFAPAEDAQGYATLIDTLEAWLAEVTGYAKVSIQPNAGSQGELAGLLAIRAYHDARGDHDRRVCLIPSSAHGTNAASAVMAGMKVVVVKAAEDGSVDLDDLRGQDRDPPRPAGRDHGHLPLDPRRVRGDHRRPVRAGARRRRPGLRRRRQPERAARAGPAGPVRGRRQPPQPAQDVLHPARRRRPGRRPGRGGGAPGAVPAQPPAARGRGAGDRGRPDLGRPVRLGRHPADQLRLHRDDGRRRADRGHRARAAGGQLRGHAAGRGTTRCSTPAAAAGSPTSASSTCGR